jgi:hypothetical protein
MTATSNPQAAADQSPKNYRDVTATWGDLNADEIEALYEQLHRKGRRSIYISCNRAECSALANSFDQLFKRLGWPSTIGEGGILALGVTGLQVNPNDDTARLLKSAIEARTQNQGRCQWHS